MDKNKISLTSVILIIILGFAVYSNSILGQFIWDDNYLVKDNVYIRNWSHINKIFTRSTAAGAGGKESISYRPLQVFTFLIDHSLWGLDVKGYHLTNIILHILVALSIFWLVNILYGDRLLCLLTSILFLVHPIHTEAIAYISGRADPLGLLFMLLCFILYIKNYSLENTGLYILILLSYALALLSRESSLILPGLLLLYHYIFRKKIKVKGVLSIASISLIYIVLRLTVLSFKLPHLYASTTILDRIPGLFVALADYTRLLFLPFNLHMEYGNRLFHLADPKAITGLLVFFLLLIYAFKRRHTDKLVSFSIFWFFVALLPSANLYPINAYMAEHWLYAPSIGFFLLLANGLSYMQRAKHLKIFALISTIRLL